MKIIPTWPRANLPRFYQTALQDCTVELFVEFANFTICFFFTPTEL